jgi:hypothetical protein
MPDTLLLQEIGRLEPNTRQQPSAMIRVLPGLQISSRMVQSTAPAILTLYVSKPLVCRPFLSQAPTSMDASSKAPSALSTHISWGL